MMNKPPTMMNQYQHKSQQHSMNMNQSLIHHQQFMNRSLIHQQQSMNQIDQQVFDLNNLPFPHPPVVSQSINRPIDHPQFVQMNRSYGMWAAPPQQHYQNPNRIPAAAMKPPSSSAFNNSLGPRRGNWKKGKRLNNDKNLNFINYDPQTSIRLQHRRNRTKTRMFPPKRKFNKNTIGPAPSAPRNTSSYIIRAKKSGGLAPLVSPPATPTISPFREEEWGLDGYGSMDGLVVEAVTDENGDEEDEGGLVENDVEDDLAEVERRMMDDLDRMINGLNDDDDDPDTDAADDDDGEIVLEDRIDDEERKTKTNNVQLEEENMILKEKLVLMEKELDELRKRMSFLERRGNRGDDDIVNNASENESDDTSEDLDEECSDGDNCLLDEKVDYNSPC